MAALNDSRKAETRWPVIRWGERERIDPLVRWIIFQRDGGFCTACGTLLTIRTAELDHIVPWSAGGTDASENLRVLCHWCNAERSNFVGLLDVWAARRQPVCWGCAACSHLDDYGQDVCEPAAIEPDMVPAFCGFCGIVSRAFAGTTL